MYALESDPVAIQRSSSAPRKRLVIQGGLVDEPGGKRGLRRTSSGKQVTDQASAVRSLRFSGRVKGSTGNRGAGGVGGGSGGGRSASSPQKRASTGGIGVSGGASPERLSGKGVGGIAQLLSMVANRQRARRGRRRASAQREEDVLDEEVEEGAEGGA